MNVSKYVNIAVKDDVSTIEISGDIGYNPFADTFEEYKANTSANIKAELNAIQNIQTKKVKVVLESLGGDLNHGLAIRSLLVNSGAEVEVYLRGANASSSTIIATATKDPSKVYMDTTGMYLIHKPMTGAFGNSNDFEQTTKDLNKWQSAVNTAYLEMGIEQSAIDDLMERNGGHGDWLDYAEAKEFGFVGNKWETKKISNYTKELFINKNLLIPKNLKMEENKNAEVEQSLLQKIWNKLSTEKVEDVKVPVNEVSPEEQTAIVNEVMQILEPRLVAHEEAMQEIEPRLVALEESMQAMKPEEEVEAKEDDEEEDEVVNTKVSDLENKVKELTDAIANSKETPKNKVEDIENAPFWKQRINGHK